MRRAEGPAATWEREILEAVNDVIYSVEGDVFAGRVTFVNGQVDGSPAAQDSMSISSFAPATTTEGSCASMATAGSFCLFWENGVDGLPTVTS